MTRTLILGRDRVGICPLYYAEADGWLLWGSEIKALLASGLVAARPDPRGIDHLFTFFCAGTTRTFFEGVKSLPPGHFLKVRDGRVTPARYWDLDFPDAGDERRLDDPTPAGRRARGPARSRPSSAGCAATCRSSATSAAGLIRRSCSAFAAGSAASRSRRSRSGSTRRGPTSAPTRPRPRRCWARRLTTVTMDRAKIADDVSRADPGRRGTGPRYLVRGPAAAGAVGPRARVQGRPDRRGGRRGAGRLRLVQDAGDPRRRHPAHRPRPASARSRKLLMSSRRRRPASACPRAGHRRRPPRSARPLRADLPGEARVLFERHVAAAGRP